MRLRESRAIANRRGIEHHDIRKHAFLQKAATIQTQIRRRQSGDAPNGFG